VQNNRKQRVGAGLDERQAAENHLQMLLAFTEENRSEVSKILRDGTEWLPAKSKTGFPFDKVQAKHESVDEPPHPEMMRVGQRMPDVECEGFATAKSPYLAKFF
jgi:hypothetical protein